MKLTKWYFVANVGAFLLGFSVMTAAGHKHWPTDIYTGTIGAILLVLGVYKDLNLG